MNSEYEPWRGRRGTCFFPKHENADITVLCHRKIDHFGNHAAWENGRRIYWRRRDETSADTVGRVSPNPKRPLKPADEQRIGAALTAHQAASDELRDAVLAAAANGASVRELAEFTGKSTNTISRWKASARS